MKTRRSITWVVLLGVMLSCGAGARGANADSDKKLDFEAAEHQHRTIYHSPQTPGYTCWLFAWVMPDQSVMITFYQATGPMEGRPRAPIEIQKKLSWPHLSDPRRDMTGLKTCNVYLRSTDGGATWKKVSEDFFRSPMNGPVNGTTGLSDGTILRAVLGNCLPYDADVPWTGLLQRSTDGTKTWSKLTPILPPDEITLRPVGIRQLRDGRVIVMGGVSRISAGRRTADEYCKIMEPLLIVSNDGGRTWGSPIPVVPEENRKGWGCEECDAAELPNGDLFWVFRRPAPEDKDLPWSRQRHVQWQGVMEKQGDTWTPKWVGPAPFGNTGLPNLVATREGVILHVKVSSWTADAGKTWHRLLNLPDMGYYPKGVQLADGRILVFAHTGSDDQYGAVDQSIVMDSFRLKAR
jgi:hypothetical protein